MKYVADIVCMANTFTCLLYFPMEFMSHATLSFFSPHPRGIDTSPSGIPLVIRFDEVEVVVLLNVLYSY